MCFFVDVCPADLDDSMENAGERGIRAIRAAVQDAALTRYNIVVLESAAEPGLAQTANTIAGN